MGVQFELQLTTEDMVDNNARSLKPVKQNRWICFIVVRLTLVMTMLSGLTKWCIPD